MTSPLVPHREIETKLEVPDEPEWEEVPDPTVDAAVAATGVVVRDDRQELELDARYYDTERLDLLASRVTLRRRTGGHDPGWHLKLPGNPVTARFPDHPDLLEPLTERREWQVPLAQQEGSGRRDDASVPPALLAAVIGTARGRWISPVARLRTRRFRTVLRDAAGTPVLEIADDHVEAQRFGDDDTMRWREVEVELLEGTTTQLQAVVDFLIARGATVSQRPSKIGTVLTLPQRPESATSMAGRILSSCRDSLIAADRSLRMDAATSAPQSYAAIRAAHAVVQLLGVGDRPSTEVLGRWEDAVAGERDVQVGRAFLVSELTDTHARYADAARAVLELELTRRERRLAEAIADHLDSTDHVAMLQDWDDLADGVAAPPLHVDQLEERLDALWHDLQDAVDAALSDPEFDSAVHGAYRAAVLTRDSLLALLPEFLPDAQLDAEDAIVALGTVIAGLAVHRDAGQAADLVESMATDPMTDGRVGFVLGRLYALMTSIQRSALEDFGDVWDELGETELPISIQG